MKKLILSFVVMFCIIATDLNAYELPQTQIRIPTLKKQYIKIDTYLKKNFDDKISKLSYDDKAIFDIKIKKLQDIFIRIDQLALDKKKSEVISAVNELRNNLKDIISFLKAAKINPSKAPIIKELLSDLNIYSNGSDYGEITYYSDSFEGGKTSNGNIFSQRYFSAAKCGTSLNKLIQVWLGGKSLIVKVNDRPSCSRFPYLIDLSTTAFDFLFERYKGKQKGEFIELSDAPKDYYKQYIPTDIFDDNSIVLLSGIPNTYLQNETMHINGELTLPNRKIGMIITAPSGKITKIAKDVERGFTFSSILEEVGTYELRINGSEKVFPIHVLDPNSYSGKRFVKDQDLKKLDMLEITDEKDDSGTYAYRIRIPRKDFNIVTIGQRGKTSFYSGIGDVLVPKAALNKSEPISILIRSAKTLTDFSHDFYTEPVVIYSSSVTIR